MRAQFVLLFLIAWDSAFSWMIQPRVEKQKQHDDALAQLVYDRKLADFIKAQPGMPRVHFDAEASPNIGNAYGVPVTWAMSATMLADYTDVAINPRLPDSAFKLTLPSGVKREHPGKE